MSNVQLRSFFRNEFLLKQIQWLTIILFLTSVFVVAFQLWSTSKTYKEKLDAILDLNKDEILNSIVLNDHEGIRQHLEIIRSEYDLDSTSIYFGNEMISSKDSSEDLSPFLNKILAGNYSRLLSNDFSTVSFTFQASFNQKIFKKTLLPAIFLSFGFLFLLLSVSYLVFRHQQRKIQRMLIDPLIQIGDSIKRGDLSLVEKNLDSDIEEICQLSNSFSNYNKLKEQAVFAELATQLAHDIRSPLEVLKGLKDDLASLPESSRKRVQLSINRIEEITYNLLKNQKGPSVLNVAKSEELLSLVGSVITEKKMEYRNDLGLMIVGKFDSESYGLFSKVKRGDLKSILSNLVNNSVEALINRCGSVIIELSSNGKSNIIAVSDNGLGIMSEIKESIFTKGVTSKDHGHGLGLYNARAEIESLGGSITFQSELGKGTRFIISLPKSGPTSSFLFSIDLYRYNKIIVLDDDLTFHEVWAKRFSSSGIEIENYYSVAGILEKYSSLDDKTLLLTDFELMDDEFDGIDIIQKFNHLNGSVLVTARNEEVAIHERCMRLGLKMLPKYLVNSVRIVAGSDLCSRHVVLIDDDRLVHINWSLYCKKNGIPFQSFFAIEEFIAASQNIRKDSFLYIDSNLSDGVKGEVESERIYNLGFKNLNLATGMSLEFISKPHWINGVYSKSPSILSIS